MTMTQTMKDRTMEMGHIPQVWEYDMLSSSLRPGWKAFTGKKDFISYISEGINGNGTKFSTQLGFNVLNILK